MRVYRKIVTTEYRHIGDRPDFSMIPHHVLECGHAVPVRDPRLKKRVLEEGLLEHLRDNAAAWIMDGDGSYQRRRPRGSRRRVSQQRMLERIAGR